MKSLGNLAANEQTAGLERSSLTVDTVFAVDGTAATFGVATLQMKPEGGSVWINLTPTLTAINTAKEIRVPRECITRVALTGSTTPNLNFWLG